MRRVLCSLVCVLTLACQAHAVVFHDGISNAQRILEFVWLQGQEIKKYWEMVQTARQMVEQVKGTYQMIEMAASNLANMPKDGNILEWLVGLEAQGSALLGQVQWIGFNLDRTTRQFEVLYGNTALLTTAAGRAERYAQMRAARLEMTGLAMQTQSIKQTFTDIYSRVTTLLGVSSWASGQKALQQLQMQQQALTQKQQEIGMTMQAVSARLVAMEQAERIVREQMEEDAVRQFAQAWYRAAGAPMLPAGFNGFVAIPTWGAPR